MLFSRRIAQRGSVPSACTRFHRANPDFSNARTAETLDSAGSAMHASAPCARKTTWSTKRRITRGPRPRHTGGEEEVHAEGPALRAERLRVIGKLGHRVRLGVAGGSAAHLHDESANG